MSSTETSHFFRAMAETNDVCVGLRGLRRLAIHLNGTGMRAREWPAGWNNGLKLFACCIRACRATLVMRCGGAILPASGLFSIVLKPVAQKAVYAFLDALTLFGIGRSWGGYESLAIPFNLVPARTATAWAPGGPTVQFHVGLEAVADLMADLEHGFAALAAAA